MAVDVVKKLIMVADTPDTNGRVYPREELLKVVESHTDKVVLGSFIDIEIDCVDLSKVAIKCSNIRMEGNALVCDFTIMDTPYGFILQQMLPNHAVALSPMGVGVVTKNVVSDYELRQINVKMC